ncbi:bifunctional DNA primase/polymerase [Falsiroseomonas oryzae]|uniref:bifunctional DNA primase/polymerase n=1 Tax=Falsiroseomonas oryzae TaxID=2766473 RepID=UPI0022EA1380|nr:bifunctional DNA primase/polymerase [Roseomonas sp. MO-31]
MSGISGFADCADKREPRHGDDMAHAAIALGVPVFPCDASKRPLTPHGFKDATADPVAIRRHFTSPAAAMIGMPTGEVTALVVVDVDVKDDRQGQAWLDANRDGLPPTWTVQTASGGRHLYFRWPGQPIRNSASRIAPGVDVRGDGGYVIVPPSPGYLVANDAPLADLPDWLLSALLPPPTLPPAALPQRPRLEGEGSAIGRAALDERCEQIRNAPDGTKHHAVNEAAFAIGGMVSAGHLDEGTAWRGLSDALSVLLPRCRDQRAAERTLQRAFREGMGQPQRVPYPAPEAIHPAAPFLATLYARRAQQQAKPLPVPANILQPGGVLQMLVEECVRTALRPQPFLALGAAICAVGALAGRQYRTRTDLRTNVYVAAVAESGGGKDHAPEVIRRCFDRAGLERYLGGENLASGRGLLSALEQHPARLFQIDEFGLFLATVTGGRAPAHKAEIWSELMKLYSRAKGIYRGTEYANKKDAPRIDIHQPCVCFHGTTTPSTFWKALEGGAMLDGSLARFLVFVTDTDRPERNRAAGIIAPSAKLLEALKAIARGQGDPPPPGNLPDVHVVPMKATDEPAPYAVPMTSAAEALHDRKLAEEDAWALKVAGTPQAAIVNRLGENASKLALICAISRDPAHPRITEAEVAWGWALAEHCTRTVLRDAQRFLADSEFEKRLNKAIGIIGKHGPCSRRDIFHKGLKLVARELSEVIDALVSNGLVIETLSPATGSPGRPAGPRYVLVHAPGDLPAEEPAGDE